MENNNKRKSKSNKEQKQTELEQIQEDTFDKFKELYDLDETTFASSLTQMLECFEKELDEIKTISDDTEDFGDINLRLMADINFINETLDMVNFVDKNIIFTKSAFMKFLSDSVLDVPQKEEFYNAFKYYRDIFKAYDKLSSMDIAVSDKIVEKSFYYARFAHITSSYKFFKNNFNSLNEKFIKYQEKIKNNETYNSYISFLSSTKKEVLNTKTVLEENKNELKKNQATLEESRNELKKNQTTLAENKKALENNQKSVQEVINRLDAAEQKTTLNVLSVLGVFAAIIAMIISVIVTSSSWLNNANGASAIIAFTVPTLTLVIGIIVLLSFVGYIHPYKKDEKMRKFYKICMIISFIIAFVSLITFVLVVNVSKDKYEHSVYITKEFTVEDKDGSKMIILDIEYGKGKIYAEVDYDEKYLHEGYVYYCLDHHKFE